ncbi:MAG: DUF3592 domain-containing protein [Verrucomicrobiales bacterium]
MIESPDSPLPPEPSRKKGKGKKGLLFLVLFGFAFFGVGAFLSYSSIQEYRIAAASESWRQADGKITNSTVERKSSRSRRRKGNSRRKTRFYPEVTFRYDVAGSSYDGDRLRFFSKGYKDEAEARAIAGQFPAGSTRPVFYDPEKPGESVLQRGLQDGWIGSVSLPFIFVIVGGGIMAFAAKKAFAA